MPSHSQAATRRAASASATRTAGHTSWAQARTKTNPPNREYSSKCSNITAKWIAAAPAESAAKAPSSRGRAVEGLVRASVPSARARVVMDGSFLAPGRRHIAFRQAFTGRDRALAYTLSVYPQCIPSGMGIPLTVLGFVRAGAESRLRVPRWAFWHADRAVLLALSAAG